MLQTLPSLLVLAMAPALGVAQRKAAPVKPAADPKPIVAPVSTSNSYALPLPGPDAKSIVLFITNSCNAQWALASERYDRQHCKDTEIESAGGLTDRDMSSPVVRLIRRECYEKNRTSYTMWNGCERTKLKAASESAPAGPEGPREPSAIEAEGIIRTKCAKDWPDDFNMRAFCQKQQDEAIAALRDRSMVAGDRLTIRTKCLSDWTGDYHMRNFCEERQLEALAKIR